MPIITLSAKAHGDFQLKLVDKFLRSTLKGLQVDSKICGITPRGWVQIAVSGEDEKAALSYLTDEIGLCPTLFKDIKRFSTIKGYITRIEESRAELYVDIGVSSPKIVDAKIPLKYLQAQLVDGKKIAFKKIVALFSLCKNLPLSVKILDTNYEENYVEAMLSERQITQYRNWIESLLDRLIILGSSTHEVRLALKRTDLNRDVIDIESLGLFELGVVCKLGTDAEGLIPKIGKNLRNATFTTFNPKRVLGFLDYSTAFIS